MHWLSMGLTPKHMQLTWWGLQEYQHRDNLKGLEDKLDCSPAEEQLGAFVFESSAHNCPGNRQERGDSWCRFSTVRLIKAKD